MLAAAGTSAALALLAGITAATPAQAATASTHCAWTTKKFDLPGLQPNIKVEVDICIHREPKAGSYYTYDVYLNEVKWSAFPGFSHKRFNFFDVNLRGEHGTWHEATTYYPNLNGPASGEQTYYDGDGSQFVSSAATGWTADGYVAYDIANDGRGSAHWQLHGTASV